MKLIVALGNPTPKYAKTRHNVGFMALDFYVSQFRESMPFLRDSAFAMSAKFNAEILKCENVIFAKPQTFMNNSGESIKRIADFYKISDIAVIHDDLDLNLGAVRFKFGGGNAGHNGLKSIDNLLGKEYLRIRIGIDKPQKDSENAIIDFVLGDFSEAEMKILEPTFEIVANAMDSYTNGANLVDLQNKYTKKK